MVFGPSRSADCYISYRQVSLPAYLILFSLSVSLSIRLGLVSADFIVIKLFHTQTNKSTEAKQNISVHTLMELTIQIKTLWMVKVEQLESLLIYLLPTKGEHSIILGSL